MLAEIVVDASVFAKFHFTEDGSDQARAVLTSGRIIAAPDLIFLEIASVALKKVRQGLSTSAYGRQALVVIRDVVDELVPISGLANRAFLLAESGGFSAYDATYLALAQDRNVRLITADVRLVTRAQDEGLGHLVTLL